MLYALRSIDSFAVVGYNRMQVLIKSLLGKLESSRPALLLSTESPTGKATRKEEKKQGKRAAVPKSGADDNLMSWQVLITTFAVSGNPVPRDFFSLSGKEAVLR